jgi:2-methylisocitrate lyase-like PEP mutase family enzyme
MPFLIDDLLLRTLGISIPPFDMLWLIETITDYVENVRQEESQQKINRKIKENRLLYELGEITKEEYERRSRELNQRLKISKLKNNTNLNKRISLLG